MKMTSSRALAYLDCPEAQEAPDTSRAEDAARSAREIALAQALSDRSHELALSLHLVPRS